MGNGAARYVQLDDCGCALAFFSCESSRCVCDSIEPRHCDNKSETVSPAMSVL